jgi:hypothetical protein
MKLLILATILASFIINPVSAQVATPAPLPERKAPFGLGGIRVPTDAGEIVELFDRLPANIAGFEKLNDPLISSPDPVGNISARWGEDEEPGKVSLYLGAMDVSNPITGIPCCDGAAYVSWYAANPPIPFAGFFTVTDAGRDGDLAWYEYDFSTSSDVFSPTPPPRPPARTGSGVWFGWAGSPRFLVAEGPTREARNALVAELVEVSEPVPIGTPLGIPASPEPAAANAGGRISMAPYNWT